MKLIKLGTIVNTKGKIGKLIISCVPNQLFLSAETAVFIGFSESFSEKFFLKNDVICCDSYVDVYLKNIDTIDAATSLKEKAIFAEESIIRTANPDLLLETDIIDCEVVDEKTNSVIGRIVEVWYLPANNVWLMECDTCEVPLPVVDDVIKDVDIANKKIIVEMIDGLWETASKRDVD